MSTRNASSLRRDDEVNRVRSSPSRKNRRRWCRGKVGVEHRPAIRDQRGPYARGCEMWTVVRAPRLNHWSCDEERYCTECGKILESGLGAECTRLPDPPPAQIGWPWKR